MLEFIWLGDDGLGNTELMKASDLGFGMMLRIDKFFHYIINNIQVMTNPVVTHQKASHQHLR